MHIRFRKNTTAKISLIIIFTMLSAILLMVLLQESEADPGLKSRVLETRSLADFFISSLSGILVGSILAVVLILILRWLFFSRRYQGPIASLRDGLQRIEQGDLNTNLQISRRDSIFPVFEDFNLMRDALEKRFREIEMNILELEDIEFNLHKMLVDNSLGSDYLSTQVETLHTRISHLKRSLQDMQFSVEELVPAVLIIGSGGREHTLAAACRKSPAVDSVYAIPGSAGMADIAECVDLPLEPPFQEVKDFISEKSIDLVIIGPEQPLVDGLADALRDTETAVFGPGQAGARIEGSKSFAKELMRKYKVPTAAYAEFSDYDAAAAWLEENDGPYVLKADGLAGGKGVFITEDRDEAREMLGEYMLHEKFGAAGKTVVIEEFLHGQEASILALMDNDTIIPLIAAQDHKAAYDGDRGPNTGGMGAYAPAPVVTDKLKDHIRKHIFEPMQRAFRDEGIDYRGVLYAGLMITREGPKVIEFNCRFGDPETQVILPLLQTDFVELAWATAHNRLKEKKDKISYLDKTAVCVVLASEGYPGKYKKNCLIRGLEDAERDPHIHLFHAGTSRRDNQKWYTSGGRVLGVTALAEDLKTAIQDAYDAVAKISFTGLQYRKDIGRKGLYR